MSCVSPTPAVQPTWPASQHLSSETGPSQPCSGHCTWPGSLHRSCFKTKIQKESAAPELITRQRVDVRPRGGLSFLPRGRPPLRVPTLVFHQGMRPVYMGALGPACRQPSQETPPVPTQSGEEAGKHAVGPGPGTRRCPAVLVPPRTVAAGRRRRPQQPRGWLGGLGTGCRKSTCSRDVGIGARSPPHCWPAAGPG